MLHESKLSELIASLQTQLGTESADPIGLQDHWTLRLSKSIYCAVLLGKRVSVSSVKFVPWANLPPSHYTESDASYSNRLREQRGTIARPAVQRTAAGYVARALRFWFDLPSGFVAIARSCLVDCTVEVLGPGVLLTDIIWVSYEEFPRWLFTSDCPRKLHHSDDAALEFKSQYRAFFDAASRTDASAALCSAVQSNERLVNGAYHAVVLVAIRLI